MGQKGWDDLAAGDQTPVDRCEGSVWGRSRAEGVSKVGVLVTLTHEPRFLCSSGTNPVDLALLLSTIPEYLRLTYCPEGTEISPSSRSNKPPR